MRYLAIFFAAAALSCPLLLATAFLLAPAPIAAEYWVRQALVVKREIAARQGGRPKGLVVGGSSALFGVDSSQLTRELGLPFVNLGIHAGLPLEVHLEEAGRAAASGDMVILALEHDYYCRGDINPWYARNRIAWRAQEWREAPVPQRAMEFWRAGPWFLVELAMARAARAFLPWAIRDRLAALDDAATLRVFAGADAGRTQAFGYTVTQLDALGNMRGTEGNKRLREVGHSADAPITVCPEPGAAVRAFVDRMRRRSVEVRITFPPFYARAGLDPARMAAAERDSRRELEMLAPVLGTRADATYDAPMFFDTGLHLNAAGRRLRTDALAAAIRADAALMARLAKGGA